LSFESMPTLEEPVTAEPLTAGSRLAVRISRWGLAAPFVPVGVAIAALLLERLVPNRHVIASSGLLAGLLAILLVAAISVAVAEFVSPRLRPWARHNGPLLAGGIGLLTLWSLATAKLNWLPLPYFPGPERVLQSLRDDRETLALSTYHSLRLLLAGYALGVAAGLICGILVGWFRRVRYWGMPLLKLLGPIPATAYVPLMMVLFPSPFLSGTVLIALAVWFPVTMLTSSGIANVPNAYLDVARTLGATPRYLIFHVALPAALPNIFLGLFMGLGSAFLTLIVAETLGVSAGLGWYLKWQQGYLEYANVYAAILIMSLFFSGLMTLLFVLRDRLLSWQKVVIRW
jgi:NitT/TauT family transport system permease protein